MLKKFFKKEFTTKNYLEELLKQRPDFEWLKEALNTRSIDINNEDKSRNTFLMICLKKNKFNMFYWLLDNNADPTIKNNEHKAAIDIAIEKDKNDIVERLLKHPKIDIDQKDDYGRSLLQNIIVSGNFKMAKTLIKGGANINTLDNKGRHILYDALSYGDHTFVKHLLTYDNIELNDIDEDGNTLMQHPQIEQNDILAQDLLTAGCDPTVLNSKGESYLYKTVLRGKEAEKIVEIALDSGADVNAKTLSENTIMMELILRASELSKPNQMVKRSSIMKSISKMLKHNGDINALDANGESGLFNAINIKDVELIKFLLEHEIDPNIQNKKGQTVLEMLLYTGMEYSSILKLLLFYGIDPKLKNKDGQCGYEILTNIILHIDGTVLIEDENLVSLIDPDGFYMSVVQLLLDNEDVDEDDDSYILDLLDSHGDPLFFRPLMKNNFPLFNLYTKYKINIHMLNKQHHNIFFAYVLRVFEENDARPTVYRAFQDNISSLISRKVDKDFKDSLGWTILHKVTSTDCNLKLFNVLVSTVRFDYSITDNLGRTVIHNCVWHNKPEIIKIINKISPETLNKEDIYHIPPLYYAGLLGSQQLVSLFLDLGALITSFSQIDPKALKKFKPMLKNLEKLIENVTDQTTYQKNMSLIDQIEKKFEIN